MAEEIAIAAASEVAAKATESVYDFVGRQMSYVFKYQSHIDELKKRVEELGHRRQRIQVDVNHGKEQGKQVHEDVNKWLTSVGDFTEGVKPIIGDEDKAEIRCFTGLCPNLIKRYEMGKKAVGAAKECTDLFTKGNFPAVSYRRHLRRTESSIYVRDYEPIDSRKSNFQDIMEALNDPNSNMIGVYGMGGVGKTTLVKEVAGQALKDKLFDTVVIAEVTQTPNYKEIREKFARDLGLEFDKETDVQRIDRIRDKLKKEKKVLIILDNIWAELKLATIGIPFGDVEKASAHRKGEREGINDDQRQCKVLLTSRRHDVLRKDMKTQKNILVRPFSYQDAWDLFGTIVGDCVKESEFHDIAVEIVEKCEGLPVAIVTIASALRTEKPYVWKDALSQIGSNPRNIEGMDKKVCSIIELSYKYLKTEEAKSLFLLCGLFNAGFDISIFDLLKYSMGLGLFHNVDTLEKGRNRLYTLIDHLKVSCLLLDGSTKNWVKLHDIIHAVAVSIASTDELMFNIQNVDGLKEVLEEKIPKDSTAISLPFRDIYDELPERLECPKLKLFLLSMESHSLHIPESFFEGMKELKLLDLTGIQLLSLPSSLSCLKNLRTLCLCNCLLGDIKIVGQLTKLEVLCFNNSDIEQLPRDIGQLTRLKLLDLVNCSKLKVIPPNVISSLSRLEELHMDNTFVQWEIEGPNNQGRSNAGLFELKQLSHLTTLHIHVQDLQIIPQGLFLQMKYLERYTMLIGDAWDWNWYSNYGETSRMLKIKLNNSNYFIHRVKRLFKRTEELHLELNGFKNAIDELDEDGFPQLKHLHVQNGPELSYVVNSVLSKTVFPKLESLFLHKMSKLEKICHGQLYAESFSKLRIIKIKKCDRLKYLFSFYMAENLSQLQEIEMNDCKNLKEILGGESEDHVNEIERNGEIVFTQLSSLTLQNLPQFICFCFDVKVVFPRLENLKLSSINIENISLDQPPTMSSYSLCLKILTVEECNGLKFLFSSSMVKSLLQLQKLVIGNCKSMEAVIETEGLQGEKKIVEMSFPKLFYLKLKGLPNLTRFGTGNLVEFPSLNELHIESCSNLKTFFSVSSCANTTRKRLEEVNLESCLSDIDPLFDEKVAFPSLEKMTFLHLDNLQLIWLNQLHAGSFSKLKVVSINSCEKLMTIVPSTTPELITFPNLEILNIRNCWSMKSLFPVSIATGLVQLKQLRIYASGLEEIVAKDEVDKAPTFLFPQLTHLKLDNLLELKHFYLGSHKTEWPMLKSLMVYSCRKIKIYSSEFYSFQQTDGESQSALFRFEKVIPNLELLGLDAHDHDFKFICFDSIPTESFCKLQELVLDFFDDESVVFQFSFLQRFHSLETLSLCNGSVKELFPYEDHLWKQNSQVDPFLQNLRTLKLWRCHRLTSLNMPSSASFTNLTTLNILCCNGLENIFADSTAKSLVQLRKMCISECKLLIEVIANEIDRMEEELVFCQLKILELHCLSSLTYFCSAKYPFKFPCLEQVIVNQCPKLKIFSEGVLSTPKLKRVQLMNQKVQQDYWKNDLNSTIQHMFTGGL